MGPGGLRGLQLRWPRPFGRGGGFDSLALPPRIGRNDCAMIRIRQVLAVAAGAVFFVVLLLTLVAAQICGSLLSPEFYTSQLDENDVYEFVFVDLPTAALEDRRAVEAARSGDDIKNTPLVASSLTTARIVEGIHRIIPPDWLQQAVERNMDEFGNYAIGRSDDFNLVIEVDERADVLVAELRALIDESDTYAILYEQALIPRIEDAAGPAHEEFPFGVEVSDERITSAARAVLPLEWVRQHGQQTFDLVTTYLTGESDELAISVRLSDRVEIAVVEVKGILAEDSAYDNVYDKVVAPAVTERLGETIEGLPFGVTVSSYEIIAVMREAAPPSWVRAQTERLIDEAGLYIGGQTDAFRVEVPLVDNKRLAHGLLTSLLERKVQAEIERLPTCRTVEEAQSALRGGTLRLPACVPPDLDSSQLLDRLFVDVDTEVTRLVLDPIPDTVAFSHTRLREVLVDAGAVDDEERLDEVRSLLRDGWTYTQDDLREDLTADGNESAYEVLQNARSALSDGWTYTLADFTGDVVEREGPAMMANIDRGRTYVETARKYGRLCYLPAILLLVAVGLLGGQGWRGRFKWGAASLGVCAVAVAILSGLVYPTVSRGLIDEAHWQAVGDIDPANDYAETARLAVGKAFDVIESVSDALATGVATVSLILAVAATVILAVAIAWPQLSQLASRARHGEGPFTRSHIHQSHRPEPPES